MDVDGFFAKLTDFVKELSEEEKRGVSEQLSEEELALFDILTKPEIDMTAKEKERGQEGRSTSVTPHFPDDFLRFGT